MGAAPETTLSVTALLEALQFCLGVGVVAALFWVLYHLEGDWPERFVRERSFRQDVAAAGFGCVLAWFVADLFG